MALGCTRFGASQCTATFPTEKSDKALQDAHEGGRLESLNDVSGAPLNNFQAEASGLPCWCDAELLAASWATARQTANPKPDENKGLPIQILKNRILN